MKIRYRETSVFVCVFLVSGVTVILNYGLVVFQPLAGPVTLLDSRCAYVHGYVQ